jgi:ADP-L-glycero-D-manno-heptose 6-epimerase
MAKIIVTGATGFIGSALADRLFNEGHHVVATGTSNERTCKHHSMVSNDVAEILKLGNIDILFHQAANNDTTDTDQKRMFQANCLWSMQIFEAARKLGCKKIIYASSASVYGFSKAPQNEDDEIMPSNIYSMSKAILEELACNFSKKSGIPCIGLRYFNVYGAGESHKNKRASMIYQLCKQAMDKGTMMVFKNGEHRRDWVSVEDVVEYNIKCINHEKTDIFNVGTGVSPTMNRIMEVIKKELNLDITTTYIENPYKSFYQNHTQSCINKSLLLTKWYPKTDITIGIRNLLKTLKKQKDPA